MGGGFLDVDVFTRLASPHGGQGVPVVRCGGGDHVDILVIERFPHIRVGQKLDASVFFKCGGPSVQLVAVGVTDGHEPHARILLK